MCGAASVLLPHHGVRLCLDAAENSQPDHNCCPWGQTALRVECQNTVFSTVEKICPQAKQAHILLCPQGVVLVQVHEIPSGEASSMGLPKWDVMIRVRIQASASLPSPTIHGTLSLSLPDSAPTLAACSVKASYVRAKSVVRSPPKCDTHLSCTCEDPINSLFLVYSRHGLH